LLKKYNVNLLEILILLLKWSSLTKLFGYRWQGVPSNDVSGEYGFDFQGKQRLVSAHASTHEPD